MATLTPTKQQNEKSLTDIDLLLSYAIDENMSTQEVTRRLVEIAEDRYETYSQVLAHLKLRFMHGYTGGTYTADQVHATSPALRHFLGLKV